MWLKMNEEQTNVSLDAEIERRLKSKRIYFAGATLFATILSTLLSIYLVYPAMPRLGLMSFVVAFVPIEVLFVVGMGADIVNFVRKDRGSQRTFILS